LLIIVQFFIYHRVTVIRNQLIDLVLNWLPSQDLLLQLIIQVILWCQLVLPKLSMVMVIISVIICLGGNVVNLFFFVILMMSCWL